MPTEIERKFLLRNENWRRLATRSCEMWQGYLTQTETAASVRVRIEGDRANLNIKAAVIGAARTEYEYPIPERDARHILETLCIGQVRKTRHYVAYAGMTWEIDEFHDDNAGLIVAEIELDSEAQAFEKPEWLDREITLDSRYYNHGLATRPYRTWDAPRN